MRPPECAVCDEDLDEHGGLVTFAPTADDAEWHRRSDEEGFVGHPPNVEWFCANHLLTARNLSHLHLAEAMRAFE